MGLKESQAIAEPAVALPPMTEGEQVVEDYLALRLTLRAHPLALLRPILTPRAARPARLDLDAPSPG